jgi:integrase
VRATTTSSSYRAETIEKSDASQFPECVMELAPLGPCIYYVRVHWNDANHKRRNAWLGPPPSYLRSASVSKSTATCQPNSDRSGYPAPTDDECVKATMRGIRRILGIAPRKKAPATADRILAMALATSDDLKGLRDRALLLIGFAGAFRRSELVALDVDDIEETELGFKVTIRHSKTDQEGAGQAIAIVRGSIACPVAALKAWLVTAEITAGAVFRSVKKGGKVAGRLSAQSVADIVKAYAERVGLDPALFAGHSMRAGFLTSAAKRGASIFKMMDQSRHRSVDTLRGYVRDAELFKEHAGSGLL